MVKSGAKNLDHVIQSGKTSKVEMFPVRVCPDGAQAKLKRSNLEQVVGVSFWHFPVVDNFITSV